MKVCIVSGSHRPVSGSNKVAEYLAKRITTLDERSEVDVIKLSDEKLPLWDESMYQPNSDLAQTWQPISERLRMADAFIIISPEWAGMVTPGLKNFLLCVSKGEMSHKPAMIVSVSAGQNGAYPIAELRSSGYKNNQICYIPEHIIVRHADQMLNTPSLPQSDFDQHLRNRIDHGLGILNAYSEALIKVRESGVVDLEAYPYGM